MVYQQRWSPNIPVPPPVAPNPESNPPVSNTRRSVPMMWHDEGNFDIGQETVSGGHSSTGLNLVNVTNMTQAQLDEAAKELNREIKREAIEKKELEMMKKIAAASATPAEYHNRFADEPFLMLRETPPGDPLLNDVYDTIELIRLKIAEWLDDTNADILVKEALQEQILSLGGPDIPAPTEESKVPSDVNRLKEKVADIEQHLVPTPGTPVTVEDLPDVWPDPIPDLPTLEPGPDIMTLSAVWDKLMRVGVYLPLMRSYELSKQFNICWCLEQIRVCLNDLSRAKAPGTQEDAFKANLEGLSDGLHELETKGVFHD